jgi:hypothetical protein
LSAYKTITVEDISFISAELSNLEQSCIQASDVFNCVSTGITAALNDRIPYKDTPVLIEIIGAFGMGKIVKQLPNIPYAGITMAGICWGISGSSALARAREAAVEMKIEIERMACVLEGLRAIERRIAEGEALLYALSAKVKKSLNVLKSSNEIKSPNGEDESLSETEAKELNTSIRLVKSIKQVIETDICNADGFLTKKSGVIFRKIEKEVCDV